MPGKLKKYKDTITSLKQATGETDKLLAGLNEELRAVRAELGSRWAICYSSREAGMVVMVILDMNATQGLHRER